MRNLLLHEKKLLETLVDGGPLSDYALPRCAIPTYAFKIILDPPPNGNPRVKLNPSFTNFFQPVTTYADCTCFTCHLCIPGEFGNELFLVVDTNAREFAFMEFMRTPIHDTSQLLPYVRQIYEQVYMSDIDLRCKAMVAELRSLFGGGSNAQQRRASTLRYVRLLAAHPIMCFFLGSGDGLLLAPPDTRQHHELSVGAVQRLSLRNEIALEGWVSIA